LISTLFSFPLILLGDLSFYGSRLFFFRSDIASFRQFFMTQIPIFWGSFVFLPFFFSSFFCGVDELIVFPPFHSFGVFVSSFPTYRFGKRYPLRLHLSAVGGPVDDGPPPFSLKATFPLLFPAFLFAWGFFGVPFRLAIWVPHCLICRPSWPRAFYPPFPFFLR